MAVRWVVILVLLVAPASPALAAAALTHWGSFSAISETIIGGNFEMEVLANGPIEDPHTRIRIVRTQYLLKRGRPPGTGPQPENTVAESWRCPVVRDRIVALRRAEADELKTTAPPPNRTVLDGTEIGIDAPLIGGGPSERMVRTDVESMEAISTWIFDTVKELKDCWKLA